MLFSLVSATVRRARWRRGRWASAGSPRCPRRWWSCQAQVEPSVDVADRVFDLRRELWALVGVFRCPLAQGTELAGFPAASRLSPWCLQW